MIKKLRMWFYKQSLKSKEVVDIIERDRRAEAIGYNLWVNSLAKSGYPRNDNGTMMDCWQLYDYFYLHDRREAYIFHSNKVPKK